MKHIINTAEWRDLIANQRPNEGRFYKLDPDVAGSYIIFDLATEQVPAKLAASEIETPKQIANRQAYERRRARQLLGVAFVPKRSLPHVRSPKLAAEQVRV